MNVPCGVTTTPALGVFMNKLAVIAVLAGATALSSGAYAADPIYGLPVAPAYGFDWDGFYAGVGVGGSSFAGGASNWGAGLHLGANVTFEDFLVGVETSLYYGKTQPADQWGYVFGLEARAGYLVAPEVLVYLSGGAAYLHPAPENWYATVGAGVEFAVTDNVSIDLQYRRLWNGVSAANNFSASALWHF